MKRLTAILAALALACLAGQGASDAQPTAPISGGVKVTTNGTAFCSLGAVGHDDAGRSVAMIAGHCMEKLGDPVYLCTDQTVNPLAPACGKGTFIGTYRTASTGRVDTPVTDWSLDYAAIELAPGLALQSNTPRGLRVDGIAAAPPKFGQIVCKDGGRTGNSCGMVLGQPSGNVINTWGHAWFGDSGSPAVVGTKLVGFTSTLAANPLGPFQYVGVHGALVDMASQGPVVGRGFTPVAN